MFEDLFPFNLNTNKKKKEKPFLKVYIEEIATLDYLGALILADLRARINNSKFKEHGKPYINTSQSNLMDKYGISKPTFIKYLKKLIDNNYIEIKKGEKNKNYYFLK